MFTHLLITALAASTSSALAVTQRSAQDSAPVTAWSDKVCGSGDRIQQVDSTYDTCYDIYQSETAYCMVTSAGEAIGEPSLCVYSDHGCGGQYKAGPATEGVLQDPNDTGGAIPILSWKISGSC